MSSRIPPYYQNFDDSHCTQCALRGILEYFEPELKWSWEEVDHFTNKEPDKWTWQYRGQINMAKRGYDVVVINNEDINDFMRDGIYETFVKTLGQKAADELQHHSNLDAAKEDMIQFQKLVQDNVIQFELRIPTINDMRSLLAQGYLLDCCLNSYKLRDAEGYGSHVVLVYRMDEEMVYFHDSSVKHGGAELKIPIDKFIAACIDPTPQQWAITAYKLKTLSV